MTKITALLSSVISFARAYALYILVGVVLLSNTLWAWKRARYKSIIQKQQLHIIALESENKHNQLEMRKIKNEAKIAVAKAMDGASADKIKDLQKQSDDLRTAREKLQKKLQSDKAKLNGQTVEELNKTINGEW